MTPSVPDVLATIRHHPLLRRIPRMAAASGLLPIYVVGGFVRDAFLERPGSLDIDLVCPDPASLANALQHRWSGTVIPLAEAVRRMIFTWRRTRVRLDIARLRGEGIVDDLRHRDFTINALGVSLGRDPPFLFDPTGGLDDLRRGQIRVTDPAAFTEDPLRLLRSVRLAAQLDFVIAQATAEAIRLRASHVARVAAERLREECFAILHCEGAGRWLTVMEALGLLEVMFPETRAMRECPQGPPHRVDVLTHSLETVCSLDGILLQLPKLLPRESVPLMARFPAEVEGGISRQALLRFAALFHDVGKPDTRSTEGGRIRFLDHAERGADIVGRIGSRLRVGSRASAMAVVLVREHLRPLFLREAAPVTPRAGYRFWRDLGDAAAECLLLSLADIRATWMEEGEGFREHLRFVRTMFAFRRKQTAATARPPLLDGHALMAQMDLRPGPFVGFVLERLHEEASLGSLKTKEEAVEFLREHLSALREEFARRELA